MEVQDAVLDFIDRTLSDILKDLLHNHRLVRPPALKNTVRDESPGTIYYFGIEQILSVPRVKLFDYCKEEIALNINCDGLPIYCNPKNSYAFWPILNTLYS